MDRGAWRATVHGVPESGMTEQPTLWLFPMWIIKSKLHNKINEQTKQKQTFRDRELMVTRGEGEREMGKGVDCMVTKGN